MSDPLTATLWGGNQEESLYGNFCNNCWERISLISHKYYIRMDHEKFKGNNDAAQRERFGDFALRVLKFINEKPWVLFYTEGCDGE